MTNVLDHLSGPRGSFEGNDQSVFPLKHKTSVFSRLLGLSAKEKNNSVLLSPDPHMGEQTPPGHLMPISKFSEFIERMLDGWNGLEHLAK